MASFLNKTKIPTALDSRTKLDLGCTHITTANWMQYNVAYAKEMVPTEKLSVSMEAFTRLLPLTKPTFGRANLNNRAFFVPYRTIMPAWNEFITDNTRTQYTNTVPSGNSSTSIPNSVPYFTNAVFITGFVDIANEFVTTESAGEKNYDIAVATGSSSNVTVSYYILTSKGRQALKILESLGYEFIWDNSSNTSGIIYSALPLLAAAKIYYDWYTPSQYENYQIYSNVAKLFKMDLGRDSSSAINFACIKYIFDMINWVSYDSDYFTSAWDTPVAPNFGNVSTFTLDDETMILQGNVYASSNSSKVTNVSGSTGVNNGVPVVVEKNATGGSATKGFSQYILTALRSLNDYLKRHQLAGAKVLDRYLARFGVKLEAEKLDRSLYLGQYKVPIQIGDVMTTADTVVDDGSGGYFQVSNTGDYAGKGLGFGQGSFDYETDEYGHFIIISTLIPAVGYYQGMDRTVKHISKLDFYTPEFDNLGTQPILAQEVWTSNNPYANPASRSGIGSSVFGFSPRYAEYKFSRDKLTGNFRYGTQNNRNSEEAWHLMRNLDYMFAGSTGSSSSVVHNIGFVSPGWRTQSDALNDILQYNRIFQTTNTDEDKFNIIYNFEVASWSPMKPLYDTYEFHDNGKSIIQDVNGVKAN